MSYVFYCVYGYGFYGCGYFYDGGGEEWIWWKVRNVCDGVCGGVCGFCEGVFLSYVLWFCLVSVCGERMNVKWWIWI